MFHSPCSVPRRAWARYWPRDFKCCSWWRQSWPLAARWCGWCVWCEAGNGRPWPWWWVSKSTGNVIPMFASQKQVKKAVMSIVTDSTPVEDPKDFTAVVFQLWSLFATAAEREEMKAKAEAGGMGYGDVKKDILAKMLDYFGPMRELREDFAKRPDDVEDVLTASAKRARGIAATVLTRCREAVGFRR